MSEEIWKWENLFSISIYIHVYSCCNVYDVNEYKIHRRWFHWNCMKIWIWLNNFECIRLFIRRIISSIQQSVENLAIQLNWLNVSCSPVSSKSSKKFMFQPMMHPNPFSLFEVVSSGSDVMPSWIKDNRAADWKTSSILSPPLARALHST